jgi:hypothetical protein
MCPPISAGFRVCREGACPLPGGPTVYTNRNESVPGAKPLSHWTKPIKRPVQAPADRLGASGTVLNIGQGFSGSLVASPKCRYVCLYLYLYLYLPPHPPSPIPHPPSPILHLPSELLLIIEGSKGATMQHVTQVVVIRRHITL